MLIDQAGHFTGMGKSQVMPAAGKHMHFNPWNELRKTRPDTNRADRVAIPPKKQYWHTQLGQSMRKVGMIVQKPARQGRIIGSKFIAPILRSLGGHIDTPRGNGQYQMRDQFRALKRHTHSNNTAHGLSD